VVVTPISRTTSEKAHLLVVVDEMGVAIRLPSGHLIRIPRAEYTESWNDSAGKPGLVLIRKYFRGYFPGHESAEEYLLAD
jgi:hypothetical protein